MENNIAPNTQIGKVIIEDPDNPNRAFSLNEHRDMYSSDDEEAKYSRGGEFLENLMCDNSLEFGRRWLGLGDVYTVVEDIREFYSDRFASGKSFDNHNDAIYFTKNKEINAIEIFNDYRMNNSLLFYKHLSKEEMAKLEAEIRKGALL